MKPSFAKICIQAAVSKLQKLIQILNHVQVLIVINKVRVELRFIMSLYFSVTDN